MVSFPCPKIDCGGLAGNVGLSAADGHKRQCPPSSDNEQSILEDTGKISSLLPLLLFTESFWINEN